MGQSLGSAGSQPVQARIQAAVRDLKEFERGNDPYGEHDFGSVSVAGHYILWKIDDYDQIDRQASPSLADPSITQRVLIIMLAEEWRRRKADQRPNVILETPPGASPLVSAKELWGRNHEPENRDTD